MREPVPITYSDPSMPVLHRVLVKAVEGITGRGALTRRYRKYLRAAQDQSGPQAWNMAIQQLGLTFDARVSSATKRQHKGLLLIANHPFGVIDGFVLSWIASRIDPDFQVITHGVLLQEPTLTDNLLPIDFTGTPGAGRRNVATRQYAIKTLQKGGVVGIFPAGGVSWAQHPRAPVRDDDWKPMTGRIIQASKCDVLPIRFHGKNSLPFQIASRHSQLLRQGLLLNEVRNKLDTHIDVDIGTRIDFDALPDLEPAALSQYLRTRMGV